VEGYKGTKTMADKKVDILVVDDEEMMRELLEDVLVMEGYNVVTAEDGQVALSRVKELQPLLVISDIKMPRMNGFELLKSVKERFPEMRMIMMTGYSDDFTVKDALRLNADEYIIKPFNTQDITAVVKSVLGDLKHGDAPAAS
jgi:YesN/AraC family two-component response regulator